MSIAIKVRRVQKVFEQLESETKKLQETTGIFCLSGCGQCCTKPDIEATVLEFLPFAFEMYLQRKTEFVKEELKSAGSICTLLQASASLALSTYIKGSCTQYASRGLICRLFGYATVRDKLGVKKLSTCKLIKEAHADKMSLLDEQIVANQVPSYLNYFHKLVQIDFRLGQEFHPINESILKAIEEVEHYYQYRPFPYRHRRSA